MIELPKHIWLSIDHYPIDGEPFVLLAAWIEPSEAAFANGQMPFWDYGFGRRYSSVSEKFTGILGGRPSHFMFIEPPEAKE